MISPEHHKHPKLSRPGLGNFGRHEWAFLGAPCGVIQALAKRVIAHLSADYLCAYVDAKHQAAGDPAVLPGMLAAGAAKEYTDAMDHRQWMATATGGIHQNRWLFNDCDLVLVNGNHHAAAAQVVILDPAKADSLKRRSNQLTNVGLFLLKEENTPVFDFLTDTIPDIDRIPKLLLQDEAAIMRFFDAQMQQRRPALNGLVLAGGQSLRMGRDKGAMDWHGKPQREHVADLLAPVCSEVLISCRADQEQEMQSAYPTLPDSFLGLGPFGALLSAFRAQPDKAWLVVACDLPLLDRATIDFLVQERCVKKIATTFQSPFDQLPEPLITIWEPKAYAVLLSFLAQGYSCPRKVLINSDTQVLVAPRPEALQNVNTPEDLEGIQSRFAR